MSPGVLELLKAYGLSEVSGFLPHAAPLCRLRDPYYAPWEELVKDLPRLVANRAVRSIVDELAVLDTASLKNEQEWRRAYVILGFLAQAYVWSEDTPSAVRTLPHQIKARTDTLQRLPPSIAVPFLQVSAYHDLPPTATYATLVLWNFTFQSPFCDLTDPANLRSLHTVSGTKDEEWFFLISVALESRGGPIILELLNCIEAAKHCDDALIVAGLKKTTLNIRTVAALLERMYERCDPQIYYHDVRPLLSGSKGMASSGLPDGIFFDEGDGRGQWRQYSGGSNGQSSLIQFLDIALGVNHYASGGLHGRPSDPNTQSTANGYIKVSIRYPVLVLD